MAMKLNSTKPGWTMALFIIEFDRERVTRINHGDSSVEVVFEPPEYMVGVPMRPPQIVIDGVPFRKGDVYNSWVVSDTDAKHEAYIVVYGDPRPMALPAELEGLL